MNDTYIHKEWTEGDYRVRIVADYDMSVADARDGSNVAEIVSTSKYTIGDRDADDTETEALERGGWRLLKRYLELSRHAIAVTMIGIYDHSGITIYPIGDDPTALRDEWDSSVAGFAYVTRETFEENSGGDPARLIDISDELVAFVPELRVERSLNPIRRVGRYAGAILRPVVWQNLWAELKDVDDVLTGNVWRYVIEKRETWAKVGGDPDETRDEWETVESCGQFIGDPSYAEAEARAAMPVAVPA